MRNNFGSARILDRLRPILAGLFLLHPYLCLAAEVQTSSNPLCAVALDGPIVPGDANRLESVLRESSLDALDERSTTICLRSSGGSFDEAIKLANLIYDKGISTIVVDGSECYSACAFIFMSGVVTDRAAPYRKLSARAALGFHAPFLSVQDGRYTRNQVEEFSEDLRKAVLALLRLSVKSTVLGGSDFLKKSLLIRILESGPGEVSTVKTVADAARWNIEIYDADEQFPAPTEIEAIKNVCNNFHYARLDKAVTTLPELSLKVETYSSKYHQEDGRVLVIDSRTSDTICEIYPRTFNGGDKVSFFACSYDYWSSNSFGDCRQYKSSPLIGHFVPRFFRYSPDTRLKAAN